MLEQFREGITCVTCSNPGSKHCGKCYAVTYCSPACQKQDWGRHKKLCVPVVIKEIEGKGRGLVATRDLKMGELVMKDSAVIAFGGKILNIKSNV